MRSHRPGKLFRTPFGLVRGPAPDYADSTIRRARRWAAFRGDSALRVCFWLMTAIACVALWQNFSIARQFRQAVREDIVAQQQVVNAIQHRDLKDAYAAGARDMCVRPEYSGDGKTWLTDDHLGSTPLRLVRLRNFCSGMSLSFPTEQASR